MTFAARHSAGATSTGNDLDTPGRTYQPLSSFEKTSVPDASRPVTLIFWIMAWALPLFLNVAWSRPSSNPGILIREGRAGLDSAR